MSERIAIGAILGAHGIRGQVKLKSFTQYPGDVLSYGILTDASGMHVFDLRLDGETKNGLVATIAGICDRSAAESMKGQELFVLKSALPEADEEEFFYQELVDLPVRNVENNVEIGRVVALHNYGAGDILEIRFVSTGIREMYPFTKENFPTIDMKQGFITADLPEVV